MAVEVFSKACNTIIEARELSQLVNQREFIDSLRKLWKKLPKTTKDEINKSSRRRLPRRTIIPEKIVIPAEDHANITKWLKNHDCFFVDDDDDNRVTTVDGYTCAISNIYKAVVKAELRHSKDNLRLRFFKVLFYHLKVRLGVKHFRDDTTNAIARIIHSTTDVTVGQIAKDIASWVNIGGKYDGLCRELAKQSATEPTTEPATEPATEPTTEPATEPATGHQDESENQTTFEDLSVADYRRYAYLGPLFYWPSDVTERSLKDIPHSGKRRDQKIKMFISRGFFEVDDKEAIDRLVGRLFSSIWVQMEAAMESHSCQATDEWRQPNRIPVFQAHGSGAPGLSTTAARSHDDVVSPSSGSAVSTDEELVSSDSSQSALSNTLAAAELHGASFATWQSVDERRQSLHFGYQGGDPRLTTRDISASTEAGDNLSTAAYSMSSHPSDPDFSTNCSVSSSCQNSRDRSHRFDMIEHGQPGNNHFDPMLFGVDTIPIQHTERGIFNPEQYGWDGFHRFDVDEHGQPGYHHFDPTLFGIDMVPAEHTERSIFNPEQYGWDGFHRFDVDEHGQPGYHHFDPMLFGFDAIPNEQPDIAAHTCQADDSFQANRHAVMPHVTGSMFTADDHHDHAPQVGESARTLNTSDHALYAFARDTYGHFLRCPIRETNLPGEAYSIRGLAQA
ncbi:hypothetical protein AbraIFM66951_004824 [Aspergillus brasiliensis]|nr:hypothetical protein AbraIFM66951_004824 [Aspergillus brasiliensis]